VRISLRNFRLSRIIHSPNSEQRTSRQTPSNRIRNDTHNVQQIRHPATASRSLKSIWEGTEYSAYVPLATLCNRIAFRSRIRNYTTDKCLTRRERVAYRARALSAQWADKRDWPPRVEPANHVRAPQPPAWAPWAPWARINSRNFKTTTVISQVGRRATLSFVFVGGRFGSTYPASFPRIVAKIIATHRYHSRRETRAGRQCCELLRAPFTTLVSAIGTTVTAREQIGGKK